MVGAIMQVAQKAASSPHEVPLALLDILENLKEQGQRDGSTAGISHQC